MFPSRVSDQLPSLAMKAGWLLTCKFPQNNNIIISVFSRGEEVKFTPSQKIGLGLIFKGNHTMYFHFIH